VTDRHTDRHGHSIYCASMASCSKNNVHIVKTVQCQDVVRYVITLNVLLLAGSFTFLWLLCFSYMTSKWNRSHKGFAHRSTAEAPIAFAFFCLLIYVC